MILKDKRITIIGFGNQGFAWAMNMRDSGLKVKIALRTGSKLARKAQDHDFEVLNLKQAFINSDILCILIPDESQAELFEKYTSDIDDGQSLVFAHGYNILYKKLSIEKKVDLLLVAPKETGETLRETYLKETGTPALIAVEKDTTGFGWQITKAIAESLGCHKAGIYKSTFKEETEINLFTEQSLYLSVLPQVIVETFNTLVEAGYSKEASYYESLHKVKTIADLIFRCGLYDSFNKVSSIAKIGGIIQQPRLINDNFKKELRKILKEIQDGTFQKKVDEEKDSGYRTTQNFMNVLNESPLEELGRKLREKIFKNE